METVREYLAKIGQKGGKARLTTMTPEQRRRIAKKAAEARWKKEAKEPVRKTKVRKEKLDG